MTHPLATLATAEAIVRTGSGRERGRAARSRTEPEPARIARVRPWWSRRARREAILTRTPAAG